MLGVEVPKPGYKVITVSEEIADLLDRLKSKYKRTGIKILRDALLLYDNVMELAKNLED